MESLVFPTLLAVVLLVVTIAAIRQGGSGRAAFLRESALVLSAYFLYFLIRGATETRAEEAIDRAIALEELEARLGIFFEVDLQRALLDHDWVIGLANNVYIWAHWPVIGAIGLWLYFTRHERYGRYRNAMLLSGAIGVAIFALFPMAPPRLANPEMVDTIVQRTEAYRVMQPPRLTNQYAAIPSLHFGWNLLMGLALIRESDRRALRVFGWGLPPLMLMATIVTANHYVLDAVAGIVVVLVALAIVEWWPLHPLPHPHFHHGPPPEAVDRPPEARPRQELEGRSEPQPVRPES